MGSWQDKKTAAVFCLRVHESGFTEGIKVAGRPNNIQVQPGACNTKVIIIILIIIIIIHSFDY